MGCDVAVFINFQRPYQLQQINIF